MLRKKLVLLYRSTRRETNTSTQAETGVHQNKLRLAITGTLFLPQKKATLQDEPRASPDDRGPGIQRIIRQNANTIPTMEALRYTTFLGHFFFWMTLLLNPKLSGFHVVFCNVVVRRIPRP